MRLVRGRGALLSVLDPLDEVGGELLEVVDAGDVLAVLGIVLQPEMAGSMSIRCGQNLTGIMFQIQRSVHQRF